MPKLFYKNLWGRRQDKYRFLEGNDITTVDWQELNPQEPYYFFVPKDFSLQEEYERFIALTDIFQEFNVGAATGKDSVLVDFQKNTVSRRLSISNKEAFYLLMQNYQIDEGLIDEWYRELKDIDIKEQIKPYSYRPFDTRFTIYNPRILQRARTAIMDLLIYKNLALVTTKQLASLPFNHVFVAENISDRCLISTRTKEAGYFFPLYLYHSNNPLIPPDKSPLPPFTKGGLGGITSGGEGGFVSKSPNLKSEFLNAIKESLDYEPTPEDIFHYIYAVLYSPAYRKRYQEFLKIDFPRIPLPENHATFEGLSELGRRLVGLHLLKDSELQTQDSEPNIGYPIQGSDKVEIVKYRPFSSFPDLIGESKTKELDSLVKPENDNFISGRVYINKEQYFDGIPADVYNYYIGSYQVAEKFLKDRKGKSLSLEEKQRYMKIVAAIARTIEIQREIGVFILHQ